MSGSSDIKFKRLIEAVQKIFENAPGCHDWGHTERVLHNARLIAKREANVNIKVVEAAALLHDIGRPEEFHSDGKHCHAEIGGAKAAVILSECGYKDKEFIAKVCECVRKHRYRARSKERPVSIEEKIVYDADKLDSIGAVGIGRAFHFAGKIGAKLHNTKKEALASKSYSREDTAYREFLVKLRKIKNRLQTKTGRLIAKERHNFMQEFFKKLNQEIYHK